MIDERYGAEPDAAIRLLTVIRTAIANNLNIDAATISMESDLIADFKADSLDMLSIGMEIQQSLDINITDEQLAQCHTPRQFITILQDTLPERIARN